MPVVNLNGTLLPADEARISVFDHGLLYGDGLFETMRVYGGRLFRPEAHLARLTAGAQQLDLPLPWSAAELLTQLRRTIQAAEIQDAALRLTVTRGAGSPIPDPAACESATFFITVRPAAAHHPEQFERGVPVCLAGEHPRLFVPGVKSLCYAPFQRARQEARRHGYDDSLLTWRGTLVEASTSNLFLVRDGVLITPHLESGCLPGIARGVVLELARSAGIPIEEREVAAEELAVAEEAFLTNSVQQIVPLAGRLGEVTRALATAYAELVTREAS